MTLEEIKTTYSMRDIVVRYGFEPNSSGFIRCPFHHGDHHASLKVYDRDFNCYGCGANGDIFDFICQMEDVDFKTAYQMLGGTYSAPTFSSRLASYRARKRRQMRRKQAEQAAERKALNNHLIGVYQAYMDGLEPLSDVWCDCYNALQYQLYLHAELNGLEMRW